jgi:methionine-rich copper-binding protein CopC
LTSLRSALAAGALLLGPAVPATAHSLLLEATPAPGAVLAAPPTRVSLRFNNRVEKRLSRVRLVDGRGEAHDLPVRAEGPVDRLESPLPALGAGRWRLDWHVLSTDGHVVSGSVPFRVEP